MLVRTAHSLPFLAVVLLVALPAAAKEPFIKANLGYHPMLVEQLMRSKRRHGLSSERRARIDRVIHRVQRHNAKALLNSASNALQRAPQADGAFRESSGYGSAANIANAALSADTKPMVGRLRPRTRRILEHIRKKARRYEEIYTLKEASGREAPGTNTVYDMAESLVRLGALHVPLSNKNRARIVRRIQKALGNSLAVSWQGESDLEKIKAGRGDYQSFLKSYRELRAAVSAAERLPNNYRNVPLAIYTPYLADRLGEARQTLQQMKDYLASNGDMRQLLKDNVIKF